ncbi:GTP cyclohydrolase 1 [Vitis vinifera]|uniref:GTP cyclohydrolase 1 n=1 Tax=Vitis vinifera TaxID=29760 RepID=A0A438G4R0_VITVI|nr:GTP cyclohydrolase 1 [Vitis vinifera]
MPFLCSCALKGWWNHHQKSNSHSSFINRRGAALNFGLKHRWASWTRGTWRWDLSKRPLTIEEAVKVLLQGLGEDINREGLSKTPARVAKALREGTRGAFSL